MGFLTLKKECINCKNKVGLNRWEIKKEDACLCPDCFKRLGGIKNIQLLSKTSAEILEILNPKKEVDKPTIVPRITPMSVPTSTHSLTFKVAGVTFKTGRKSRQVMLKNMYFRNTPPFDGKITITFERYDYEGNLAIGVYSNGLQIGNVPAVLVEEFNRYWVSDNYKATFSVYQGRNDIWGCEINVNFC